MEYSRRARGLEASPSIPAKLEKLLPKTYGIMVTQEQLQATFQQLVGCTGAQAEEFRRYVAKKEAEKVRAWHEPFMEGVIRTTGATQEEAKEIWDFYATWGQYGFNMSVDGATPLTKWDGSVARLDQFRPGDEIGSVDDWGTIVRTTVVALHDHGVMPGVKVTFDDGYEDAYSTALPIMQRYGMRGTLDELSALDYPYYRLRSMPLRITQD